MADENQADRIDYRDKLFKNERVELAGHFFHGCTFENCELVYNGDRSPTFTDNKFVDSVSIFVGAATRTLYFLSNIYYAGSGGREVMEKTFAEIRDGTIHGGEIRTIAPHTVNHSLD